MLDSIDNKIIQCLKRTGRAQWKEIGAEVHLTGQAVADRVHRMEDLGIIRHYTVDVDEYLIGNAVTGLVTVFMQTNQHELFRDFVLKHSEIREAYRISGDGCYWLKVVFPSTGELNNFLDQLLRFGNYRVNLSIETIK